MLKRIMRKIALNRFKRICILVLSIAVLLGNNDAFAFTPIQGKSLTRINKDSVIRILAIGNSFSDDAIEHYLYGLAKAGGYRVIIGNLYIGGAPLDLHWKNAEGNKAAYSYRKIGLDGQKEIKAKTSLEKALADEKWDFISLQQASPKSGQFETYVVPLPLVLNYVKQRARNPKVKYVFHQTWAYAQNSNNKNFSNYGNDQMKMYTSIMEASKKAKALGKFDVLVPCGTAIQNARTSFIGDNLCRDGYHLNLDIGRYIASCTWYEAIFGKSPIGNLYRPAKVSEEEAKIGQLAAHKAIKKPYKVTRLSK
ncbi:MAG: DUF4886 domain-containing protein [Pedobacter sp.]|uniref:DUF4886 domain-containing protein n=1 Tax=Pedobacter sp. TaxID=1411316 RepID=UPI003566F6BD